MRIGFINDSQSKFVVDFIKSYALSFTLLDEEATLNDKQIDTVMQKLIKNYTEKMGATLR